MCALREFRCALGIFMDDCDARDPPEPAQSQDTVWCSASSPYARAASTEACTSCCSFELRSTLGCIAVHGHLPVLKTVDLLCTACIMWSHEPATLHCAGMGTSEKRDAPMLTGQLVLAAELPNWQPGRAVAEIGTALLHALQEAWGALLRCIGPAPEAWMGCSTNRAIHGHTIPLSTIW